MNEPVRLPGLLWLLVLLLAAIIGEVSAVSLLSSDHYQKEEDDEPPFTHKKSNLRRALQQQQRVRVVIVGAGAAGIGAARELYENGIADTVILEADNQIGGRTKKETSFVDYPLDTGASFIPGDFLDELEDIAGRSLPTREVDGVNEDVFRDYTYYDVLRDYVTPPGQNIQLNCQVRQVDYRDREIQVVCADGRRFVADRVLVTAPLSVLQGNDIVFTPPANDFGRSSRDWWGGFKIFIEFDDDFYGDYFCIFSPCADEDGENLFWDYTYSAPSRSAASNLLAGYVVGDYAERFRGLSEQRLLDLVLDYIADEFDRSTRSLGYRRHFLVDWNREPFIRGTYSSWPRRQGRGIYEEDDRVFFAGEAFPVDGEESGWVYSAFHSGVEAADEIADLIRDQIGPINPPPSPIGNPSVPQVPPPTPTPPSPVTDPVQQPSPPTPPPTRPPPPECGCEAFLTEAGERYRGENQLRIDVRYDRSPTDISWVLIHRERNEPVYVSQRGYVSDPFAGLVSTTLELQDGSYWLIVLDAAGDGLCCSNGIGFIELFKTVNGANTIVASLPGEFTTVADVEFVLP